ncbi:MAG: 5-(carboxyamino)imidazole ribonucleotide synthase [Phycisphaerales bacterium]|nr:5-(carboxyamino)imidazole ribonucleotide synthase [Phycisphaerales bacterium]
MRVGILGGGQLGLMLAQAGRRLGMTFCVLDPSPRACAQAEADLVVGAYDDPAALDALARGSDVVTFEFENVPEGALTWLAARLPVRPGVLSLSTGADRVLERRALARAGLAVPPWLPVETDDDLERARATWRGPMILKTRRGGYDGKGQARAPEAGALRGAWASLGRRACIADALVPFEREISLVGTRSASGEMVFHPFVRNVHRQGILWRTDAPARALDEGEASGARHGAAQLMTMLDHVGTLAIEFFEIDGALLANEIAPRVHNSAHWTIEGARTSQFENHLRALAGLPLGDPGATDEVTMLNLVGRLPSPLPGGLRAARHDYGKEPAPGRKLGHVTFVGPDARARADEAAALCGWEA